VRDRTLPYGLEGGGTQLHDRGIINELMAEELAIPGEETEPDQAIIEQPEVVAGKREVRRPAPMPAKTSAMDSSWTW
jgi:hypothetical protein